MNDDLDVLLKIDFLQPPADFTTRVMQRVAVLPATQHARGRFPHRLRRVAAAAGVIGGALLGLSQLAAFVFSMWVTAAAL
jgi:hypothetical protein